MLSLRELIVIPHKNEFIVIAGNMRLRALIELGYKEAICKVLPQTTPLKKLKAYTIKDNIGYGEHDWDAIANEWDTEELQEWGLDIPGFLQSEPEDISSDLGTVFKIEVDCLNEKEQEKIYNSFIEKGYKCRILTL